MRVRVVAVVCVLSVIAIGCAGASAATPTSASVYDPFSSAVHVKPTVKGSCFTGSIGVDHRGAWRCMSANHLYDPCFSASNTAKTVLCPVNGPWDSTVLKLKLTKSLPLKFANKRKASTSSSTLPWALVTSSGWKCVIITGATTAINGNRLNYSCKHTSNSLWGSPVRSSEPWQIYAAPAQAKTLSSKVAIATAWF
jgi:hypothetical protein